MDPALGGARVTAGGRDKPYAMGGAGVSAWTWTASSGVEDHLVGAIGEGGLPPPQGRYFLEACFLCRKPLASNGDVFMYRGDIPFCSEECRRERIEIDEEMERKETATKSKVARRAPPPTDVESPPRQPKARAGSILAG